MKKLILLAVVLGAVLLIPSMTMCDEERLLSVSGHGEITVDPDIAYITFGVSTVADTAEKATSRNEASMYNIVSALKYAGISKDNIETNTYDLNPVVDRSAAGKGKTTGYRCDNQIVVTVTDLSTIGTLIDAAIDGGANAVNGLRFTVKDESKYKISSLEEAVKNATAKAKAIEKAADIKIKGVKSINESGVLVRPVEFSVMSMNAIRGSETPIEAGKVTISADVQMNFEY